MGFLLAILLAQAWVLGAIVPSPWELSPHILGSSLVAAAMLIVWEVLVRQIFGRPLAMIGASLLWLLISYVVIQVTAALIFGIAMASEPTHSAGSVVRHVHLQFTYDAVFLTLTFIAGPIAGPRGESLRVIGRVVYGVLAILGVVFIVAARI